MVKDKDLKPTGQTFKPELIPRTETRIVLEQNDISQAKSSELEAKSAVLRKITSLINRYGG